MVFVAPRLGVHEWAGIVQILRRDRFGFRLSFEDMALSPQNIARHCWRVVFVLL
jgi:hypothetical protein